VTLLNKATVSLRTETQFSKSKTEKKIMQRVDPKPALLAIFTAKFSSVENPLKKFG